MKKVTLEIEVPTNESSEQAIRDFVELKLCTRYGSRARAELVPR